MDAPPVQYVTTSDGYDIAYTVVGQGVPFIFFPNMFSHAQMYWTAQTYLRPWLVGLAARFRTIVFDGRGQGLSSRGLRETQTIESLTRDLDAVVTRLSLDRFILMAQTHSTHLALRYSLEHSKQVSGLVLSSTSVTLDAWPTSLYQLLPGQNWLAFLISQMGRGMTPDGARDALTRLEQTITKEDFAKRIGAYAGSDLTDSLSHLRVPTLILHPRDLYQLQSEESMKVAARIPGARFALIVGGASPGEAESGLTAIDAFVAALGLGHNEVAKGEETLSNRELEVLRLIATGKSNQQIAEELVISVNTVIRHVANIFNKTGAANRAQATAYSKDHGIA